MTVVESGPGSILELLQVGREDGGCEGRGVSSVPGESFCFLCGEGTYFRRSLTDDVNLLFDLRNHPDVPGCTGLGQVGYDPGEGGGRNER